MMRIAHPATSPGSRRLGSPRFYGHQSLHRTQGRFRPADSAQPLGTRPLLKSWNARNDLAQMRVRTYRELNQRASAGAGSAHCRTPGRGAGGLPGFGRANAIWRPRRLPDSGRRGAQGARAGLSWGVKRVGGESTLAPAEAGSPPPWPRGRGGRRGDGQGVGIRGVELALGCASPPHGAKLNRHQPLAQVPAQAPRVDRREQQRTAGRRDHQIAIRLELSPGRTLTGDCPAEGVRELFVDP